MAGRAVRALLFLSWVAIVPSVVSAQATGTVADASMDSEAHALFEAGRTAFAAGRFADALGDFQRAYDLSHRAVLLYNIGQCHDRLRHDADALAAFEGFVEGVPDSPQHAEVEARIALLREAIAHATPAEPEVVATEPPPGPDVATDARPVPEPAEPPPAESHDVGPGPWVVLGVGLAVAIAGGVLVGLAFDDIAKVQNAARDTPFPSVRGPYDQAPILSGVGFAAIGVGAAMAVVGIVWGVAGSSSGSDAHAELHIVPGGLSLTGSF